MVAPNEKIINPYADKRVEVSLDNPITKIRLLFWKSFLKWPEETIIKYLSHSRSFFNRSGAISDVYGIALRPPMKDDNNDPYLKLARRQLKARKKKRK